MKTNSKEEIEKHYKNPIIKKEKKKKKTDNKKTAKALPENFFENLFNLELAFKKTQAQSLIKQIISEYIIAVEYYEWKKDIRSEAYQRRLQLFITQPEVVNHLKKNDLDQPQANLPSSIKAQKRSSQELSLKINYLMNLTDTQNDLEAEKKVKDLIENPKEEEDPKNLINDDLSKQQNQFQEKLKQIKLNKSRKGSKTHTIEVRGLQSLSSLGLSQIPQIQDILIEDKPKCLSPKHESQRPEIISTSEVVKEEEDNKEDEKNMEDREKENKKEEKNENQEGIEKKIDNSFNSIEEIEENKPKEEDKLKEVNETKEENREVHDSPKEVKGVSTAQKLSHSMISPNQSEIKPGVGASGFLTSGINLGGGELDQSGLTISSFGGDESEEENELGDQKGTQIFDFGEANRNIGPKQERGFLDIKQTLDNYVNEFNSVFYKEVFKKYVKKSKQMMEDKFNKYIEIAKMYTKQIKEIQSQLSILDQESEGAKMLFSVIESLKEEQQNELDILEDEFNGKIADYQNEFKKNTFKTDPAITLIEEKFRLSMCNKINDLIMPTK